MLPNLYPRLIMTSPRGRSSNNLLLPMRRGEGWWVGSIYNHSITWDLSLSSGLSLKSKFFSIFQVSLFYYNSYWFLTFILVISMLELVWIDVHITPITSKKNSIFDALLRVYYRFLVGMTPIFGIYIWSSFEWYSNFFGAARSEYGHTSLICFKS